MYIKTKIFNFENCIYSVFMFIIDAFDLSGIVSAVALFVLADTILI
jgi:hypothetical protein